MNPMFDAAKAVPSGSAWMLPAGEASRRVVCNPVFLKGLFDASKRRALRPVVWLLP